MHVEQLTAAVRPRNPWEATDLGLRLLQAQARTIYSGWLLLVWPLALLLALPFWNQLWIAAILLWWLKPLFEMLPLLVLSRSLFGQQPTLSEVLSGTLQLWKQHGFVWLTIGRLSYRRSFVMPVRVLEGLSGKPLRQRQNLLCQRDSNAFLVLMGCVVMELIITLTIWAGWNKIGGDWFSYDDLVQALEGFQNIGANLVWLWLGIGAGDVPVWLQWLLYFALLIRITIICPYYSAAGFALYINRRTVLEGWDLELQFQRLAQRLKRVMPTIATSMALTFGALLLLQPSAAIAEVRGQAFDQADKETLEMAAEMAGVDEIDARCVTHQANREQLAKSTLPGAQALSELLEGDKWQACETIEVLRWINEEDTEVKPEQDDSWTLPKLADIVVPLLWALFISGMAVVVFLVARWLLERVHHSTDSVEPDDVRLPNLTGLEALPETLPDDIIATVRSYWAQGQPRLAIGLLYRASLQRLANDHRLSLQPAFTEGDCLNAVHQQVHSAAARFFTTLSQHWTRLAYGGLAPSETSFQQLCQDWQTQLNQPEPASAAVKSTDSATSPESHSGAAQ